MPQECEAEVKSTSHALVSIEPVVNLESVLDPGKFSTLSRLLGVTDAVLCAVRRFKDKGKSHPPLVRMEEFQEAETLWVKTAQMSIPDPKTQHKQFNLFKDDEGLWRCGGRLANSNIPYATKFPILLPKSHPLSGLVVQRAHEKVLHNGVKDTLVEVRAKFWIPSGRSLAKKIVHRCVTCRRMEGQPYKPPRSLPLPKCRVTEAPAFTYTGVDFAGPLQIRAAPSSHAACQGMDSTIHLLCDSSITSGCDTRPVYDGIHPLPQEICRSQRPAKTLYLR